MSTTTTSIATTTTSSSRSHHHPIHHHPPSASRPVHSRHRSASDPFLDIYTAPSVPYAESRHPRSNTLPPAPPVPSKASKKPRQYPDPRDPRMLEAAVRDSVTVRPVEAAPRTKMGRSMTRYVQLLFLFFLSLERLPKRYQHESILTHLFI